jgi:Uracil DNA glycosylase superfamily.
MAEGNVQIKIVPPKKKIVVAFLQNTWVKNPEKLREMFSKRDEEFRLQMIKSLLFEGGSLTGKRLSAAFGWEICKKIIWEEGSTLITNNPRQFVPPEENHIKEVIEKHKPDLVISFGKANEKAIMNLCDKGMDYPVIYLPHPAARQYDTVAKLKKAKEVIESYFAEREGKE